MSTPSTLPDGWSLPTIADIARAVKIGPFGSALKKHEYSDHGIRVLGIEDVLPNELTSERRQFIPERKFQELSQYQVDAGDILVTNMGTVGRACVVPETLEPSIISSHLIKLSLDLSVAHPDYISWVLNACPLVVAQIRATSHGAIMAGFNSTLLRQLHIPLPPLSEQRRITAILDKADGLRAQRRVAIDTLDSVPEAMLDHLRRVHPEGWRMANLGDAFWFQEGPGVRNWQFRDAGVKLLNVANIEKNGTLNLGKTDRYLSHEEIETKYSHFLVDAGDLVIASSGISFAEDGLLRTRGAFVESQHLPLCMNTSTIRFKSKPGVSSLVFLWVWLKGTEFRSQITKLVTGSAQQNFGPSHLKALRVSLPPFRSQETLASQVAMVQRARRTMLSSFEELDRLLASLLHRAFRGEL